MTEPSSSSSVGGLHGEATDPAGDALSDPRAPTAPDLVRATIDVGAGNLTIVVQFRQGTFDRQTTRAIVLLDTDDDGTTWIREGNGLGADYGLDLTPSSGQASVTKANPTACAARQSCFDSVGSAAVTVTTDGMQTVVPLSLLGNDDGRLSFQVNSYVLVAPLTPVTFDNMPDNNLPPARVR